MKRKTFLTMLPAAILATSALAAKPETKGNKMLVVYYSWSGNTRVIAETIKKLTSADMLEILPETPYPAVYGQTVDIAKKETDAKYCRPVKNENPRPLRLRHGFCRLAQLVGNGVVANPHIPDAGEPCGQERSAVYDTRGKPHGTRSIRHQNALPEFENPRSPARTRRLGKERGKDRREMARLPQTRKIAA